MLRTNPTPPDGLAYLNAALALACCVLDLALLAVPLVGLLFLPSLFGAACWASAAPKRAGLID